ncbi:MAG: 2-amino-4-hydroxy-6-hydroxymethyldihydropteridine diphosphokinase [Rhodoferax sp.]|nr:2-amino-4-hydroxy-6-hydroxymethyldihydropteridine diphosphokinase [Rhodoferax sp.]
MTAGRVPRRPLVTAYIGLGANLGDAASAVRLAMEAIAALPDTAVTARSSLYLSAPVDSSGPDYVNAVVEVSTLLSAPALLTALQAIEQAAGRERPYLNAPRTLDLDILTYGDATVHSPRLTIPHPRMAARAFVLFPMAEVAPDQVSDELLRFVSHQNVRKLSS